MKDPAIIFYTSDFMVGVSNLTMEERGQYITLLCLEHQLGHLSKKTIDLNIHNISEDVLKKFELDDEGLYYNKRLEYEIEKRTKFINHQVENGKKGGRPKTQTKPNENPNKTQIKPKQNPLENENEIENEIKNINLNEIIDYLNFKTNKHFKYTASNIGKIRARINEGFTKEDFKQVIDKKCLEWLNDKKMNTYLRPETLFGTKFESYLQQDSKEITLNDLSLEEIQKMKEVEYEKDRVCRTNENFDDGLF